MGLLFSSQGQRRVLELIVAQKLSLRVYTNDHEPTPATSMADLVEPRGRTGYKPRTLDSGLWTIVESGDEGVASYAQYQKEVFQFDSPPLDLFGYFVQTNDETLMWAERFPDGPWKIKTAGG